MFSFSGRIAEGASDALDKVLERRMREELRAQQERQHAEQVALERERMASAEADRASDRAFREGQVARQDAQALYSRTDPGAINPESAAAFRKDPGLAPLVGSRKVIDARPITAPSVLPGPQGAATGGDVTASMDTSGPQTFDVLEATPAQAEKKLKTVELQRITKALKGAPDAAQRRGLGFEAAGAGVAGEIPRDLFDATDEELATIRAKQLADERAYGEKEWSRREDITTANAEAREARQEQRMIDRVTRAAAPDPKTQAEQRQVTIEAARNLLSSPGLSKMTGARGREYLFGLRDDPLAGTEAAEAKEFFKSLQALLALPKLSYLKGPMSDKDIEFVKSAATSLSPNMKDETFRKTLTDILFRLENPTGDNSAFAPASGHGGGLRPAASHAQGPRPSQSALDILNGRRAQQR